MKFWYKIGCNFGSKSKFEKVKNRVWHWVIFYRTKKVSSKSDHKWLRYLFPFTKNFIKINNFKAKLNFFQKYRKKWSYWVCTFTYWGASTIIFRTKKNFFNRFIHTEDNLKPRIWGSEVLGYLELLMHNDLPTLWYIIFVIYAHIKMQTATKGSKNIEKPCKC